MESKTYGSVVPEMVGKIMLTLEGTYHVMLSKHSVVRHRMHTAIESIGMWIKEIGHGTYSFHAYHRIIKKDAISSKQSYYYLTSL